MGACKESCASLRSILLCAPQNEGFAGGGVTRSSALWEKGDRRADARAAVWEQPLGVITQGGGEHAAGVSLLVGGEGAAGSSYSVVEKTHMCSASLNSSPSPSSLVNPCTQSPSKSQKISAITLPPGQLKNTLVGEAFPCLSGNGCC